MFISSFHNCRTTDVFLENNEGMFPNPQQGDIKKKAVAILKEKSQNNAACDYKLGKDSI